MFTRGRAVPAGRTIQPAFAEPRFALRTQVDVTAIRFDDLADSLARQQAGFELGRSDQREIVRGAVVLGVTIIDRTRQPANRQIEARRTQLPFIVAVRLERNDTRPGFQRAQRIFSDPVDLGIAAPATL